MLPYMEVMNPYMEINGTQYSKVFIRTVFEHYVINLLSLSIFSYQSVWYERKEF